MEEAHGYKIDSDDFLFDVLPHTNYFIGQSSSTPTPSLLRNPFQSTLIEEATNEKYQEIEIKELSDIPVRQKGKARIENSPDAQLTNSKNKKQLRRSPILLMLAKGKSTSHA
jgi:hypothetical protein